MTAAHPSNGRETKIAGHWQAAALFAAMLVPLLATWLYFVVLAGHPSMQIAYTVSKVIQFGFPLVWVVLVQRARLRPHWPSRAGLAESVSFGLLIFLAALALYYGLLKTSPVLADAPREIHDKLAGFGVDTVWKFFALATFYSLVHSLLEEYYWRWFVFGQLSRHVPLAWAVALSSVAFMAHHVLVVGEFLKSYGPATWFLSACVAVGGAVWAWLYHRSRSLYGPWASHLLVDAALMWIGYDLWRSAWS